MTTGGEDRGDLTIVIPTFNGAKRIGACLDALAAQDYGRPFTTIVVNDGSTDATSDVVRPYPRVTLLEQANAGPAAARNRGAMAASSRLVVFIDDDCVPRPDWLSQMMAPFAADPEIEAVKGAYLTRQTALAARFVQLEYEDRYDLMDGFATIDFIDTYSAAFVRDSFLALGGYDTSFPVACAEDAEFSFRMAKAGKKMVFNRRALVYHTHPADFTSYFRKKYKFAYWRILAVAKNPGKILKDSHTPQIMKLQLLGLPGLVLALAADVLLGWEGLASGAVLLGYALSTLPFTGKALRKDPVLGYLAPAILFARSAAQFCGVMLGMLNVAVNRRRLLGGDRSAPGLSSHT